MKLRLFVVLIFWGLICNTAGFAETERITVATLSGNTGLAMAKLLEGSVEEKSAYQIRVYKSPDLLLGKLVSGELQIAALPTNMAAILYNKGAAVKLTSIIGWGVMYLVGLDSEVKQWSDLKGKQVMAPGKGTVADLLFRYLLVKNGLKPEADLDIQYYASPVELAQLVASGKSPLAVLPEPWVTEVIERNPQVKVRLDFQAEWKRVEATRRTYPQTAIVVNAKFAAANRTLVNRFLQDLNQSIEWINQNPGPGGALAEKYLQLSAVSVEKGISRANLSYADGVKVRPEIEKFLGRLMELVPEAIGGRIPNEDFYYQP